MMEDETYPVKPGDWIARREDPGQVAVVKNVYREGDSTVLVDLYLYNRKGDRIGRESPVCGGPRTFEPACDFDGWERISEPNFPIQLKWVAEGDKRVAKYHHGGETLPNREWRRPKRRVRSFAVAKVQGNFDPELEVRARMMAAQELRDTARSVGQPAAATLITRAEALEKEAARFKEP